MAHTADILLTEAAAIIMLNIIISAFKRNRHLPAKRTCDAPCPQSATLPGFFSMSSFDRLPDVKPVSMRTTMEDAMQKYSRAQTAQRIGLSLQEELSSSFSGMPC